MNKPTFKGFLLGATALAVTSMPAVAGQDQDQVIRDLQQQLQALQNEVTALKSQTDAVQSSNREMYKSIRRVEQGATPPKMVTSGQKKFHLSISGQVNRAVMWADDGVGSRTLHVDNTLSTSRIRWIGKGKINEDISIGSNIEMQVVSNGSNAVGIDNATGPAENVSKGYFEQRKIDASITSKSMGKLSFGQGDPASNGAMESDVSGTATAAYSFVNSHGGAIFFRDSATGASTMVSPNDKYANLDGQSRTDRIRYDTPSFAGFSAAVSHLGGGNADVALRYTGKVAGTLVRAAVFYLNQAAVSATVEDAVGGSISARHSSGVGLSIGVAHQDNKGAGVADEEMFYIKGSYLGSFFNLGKTGVSIDYATYDDRAKAGDEYEGWGFQAVQKVAGMGAEFYLDVREHTFDDETMVNYDDIWVVTAGGRFRF